MRIFDLFRSTRQTTEDSGPSKTDDPDLEATRLIKEGRVLEKKGKLDEAMQRYLKAIQIAPNPAQAHLNHGNVLLLKGNLQGALDAFRTAIKHKPDYAEAYHNIGNALLGNGELEKAAASYRSALKIFPDYAEAHCAMGIALKELGQFDSALACFHKALLINPNLAEVQLNLDNVSKELFNKGNFLAGNGQQKDAVKIYRQVLKIKPDFAEAHCNLGLALQELGQPENAVASFRRTLEIKPGLLEAHYNLGVALQALGQLDNAVASYQQALKIKPDFAEAHCNLGVALKDLGQLNSAVACYRRATNIQPGFFDAHNNLGLALKDLGQLDDAVKSHRLALKIKPDSTDAFTNQLFILNYTASHSSSYCLEQARHYGQLVSKKVTKRFSAWRCAARPERLRVGLVSGDFRKHSVGYFLEGLLSQLDLSRFELTAYPTIQIEDELTTRIRPYFSRWQPLFGQSDEAAARLIHSDGVHVLIDLSGHTAHNRLPVFAWKPAPVQVTWLGFPATTGVAEIDYVLGDPYATPAEFEAHFSEAIWRMPESYLCLAVPDSPVEVAPLPALSSGHVTYGSFNNLTKMSDAVLAVWSRILLSVPNSRLYLKTSQFKDAYIIDKTRQRFAAFGIAPDRLLLGETLASRDDHLAAYNKVDIALDTFPYPGVTTSAEALWMGVPVLSMWGNRFLSRTSESIAHNAGLPDWIAANEEEYVAKAVTYAANLEQLAALRNSLRQQVMTSPLFDAPRFAQNFGNALWGMWQSYQTQQEKSA